MRFDATLKDLFERYPFDLPRFLLHRLNLGQPRHLRFIDADVSTVTAAGDKVIRVGGRRPWLFHVELQSAHKHLLDRQLLLYNVLLSDRHGLPVRTAVLLLRPEADRASLTGQLRLLGPDGSCYLTFHMTFYACGKCRLSRCSAAVWDCCLCRRWPTCPKSIFQV